MGLKAHIIKVVSLFIVLASVSSCTKVNIEGKEAPEFTLEKFGGGNISLSELKGKPVMLYWFAGW